MAYTVKDPRPPPPPRSFLYLTETKSWKWEEEEGGGEKVSLKTHATARGVVKNKILQHSKTSTRSRKLNLNKKIKARKKLNWFRKTNFQKICTLHYLRFPQWMVSSQSGQSKLAFDQTHFLPMPLAVAWVNRLTFSPSPPSPSSPSPFNDGMYV